MAKKSAFHNPHAAVKIKEVRKDMRRDDAPYKRNPFGRARYTDKGVLAKKPRLYFFIEGENILENIAYRTNRPTQLYRDVLPEVLDKLGLPQDTACKWRQYAGCSCPCSPGFVIDHDVDWFEGYDVYVTVEANPEAKVKATAEALEEAAHRADQVLPILTGAAV